MNGILSYAAPIRLRRRGVGLGVVSTCIATAVLALPFAISIGTELLRQLFSRPGSLPIEVHLGLMVVLVPTATMLALPALGMLFGVLSVAINRRACDAATVGLVINLSGLLAAVGSVLFH